MASRTEPDGVSCHSLPVARRAPGTRLSQTERVRLAAEIVAAYAQARRALRRAPIASVVATLRSQAPSASPMAPGDGSFGRLVEL